MTALIRGDLPGCHPQVTTVATRSRRTRQKSAEAIVPAGKRRPGRAKHQESESMDQLETTATIAANPWNMGLPKNDPR
jgi:hypothetical protein